MRLGMLVAGVALVLALCVVARAQTPGSNIDSYIEVLRSDVQARKTKILAEALKLDDAEARSSGRSSASTRRTWLACSTGEWR